MTNKVNISYPSRTRQTYASFSCPPSVTYGSDTVQGNFTDIVVSSNSPRVNGKLQLRQNELNAMRVIYPPPIYEVTLANDGECPTSSNRWYSAHLTADTTEVDIFPGLYSDSMDTATQKALLSFLSKVNSTKLNIAQIFAERQQTVNMIASNIMQLVDTYRDLRRGRNPFTNRNSKPLKQGSKELANRWLEYSYGWAPLVSDVYSALELQKLQPPSGIVRSRGTVNQSKTYYNVPKGSIYDTMESWSTEVRQKSSTCAIRARVTLDNPNLSFATSVGLTNPALLTWELLPYSFVVDWFLPVGSWLEAQTALLGVTLTDVSTTRTAKFRGDSSVSTTIKQGQPGSGGGSGTGSYIEINKNRQLSLPLLEFPKLKNPLSVGHALNALALLRQVFT
jgi:hypothetical protein